MGLLQKYPKLKISNADKVIRAAKRARSYL